MPEGVIVDTDILIDAGRNVTAAVTFLDQIEQRCFGGKRSHTNGAACRLL